jgi:LPS-assembly protein
VTHQWTLLGRFNYSLADRKLLEGIAGVEYNGDCWVLRAVLHRLATTVDQTNTSFFIQLELNGLARVGTSPLDLLKRSVPGYVPVNDPLLMQRDRTADPLPEF